MLCSFVTSKTVRTPALAECLPLGGGKGRDGEKGEEVEDDRYGVGGR